MKKIAIIENNILATYTIREKLTRVLMESGYHVSILTTGTAAELNEARANGFNVIDVKASTKQIFDVITYIQNLHKALNDIKPDVCLTFTIRPAIWGNIVTRKLRIPTITNITGIGPLFEKNNLVYKAARLLYKVVLKKTKKVFFQNFDDMNIFLEKKFIKEEVAERIPGSGIDFNRYLPQDKTEIQNKFIFLFISRLVKDKGIVEFVQAARNLKAKLPNVEFRVLGPIWLQNLKENTVTQSELDEWVKEEIINYLGETKDVRNFIANADCIVLPSYREGASNVLLEASSMERPCITCNTTGCKEIVEDGVTGYLCKVKDVNSLTEKMAEMYLLPKQKLKEMGVAARKKVVKEFDKQIVIEAYLREICQILYSNEQ